MDFALTDDQEAIHDAIQKICAGFDDAYWLKKDRDGGFPYEFYDAIARAGWLGICIPEQYGGAGLGITEAAILAAGYAPAIGFVHTGKPLSFVYDVADLFKFETVVPAAFRVAARLQKRDADLRVAERETRRLCRDLFRETRLLARLIPTIETVLDAGELPRDEPAGVVTPAIPSKESSGDAGHRG